MTANSTEKLVKALIEAGASKSLIERAKTDAFHDFKSSDDSPIINLVQACRKEGLAKIAHLAMKGEFDATPAEAQQWARGPGRDITTKFGFVTKEITDGSR